MTMITFLVRFGVALCLVLGVAACGEDDGGSVTSEGSGSGSASASGSGSASGSASEAAAGCTPVGEDLEADAAETVAVELSDYAFDPSDVDVAAGVVTFEAWNVGEESHELAFLPGGGEVPFADGAPDEDALADAGAFELEAFPPGETCNATYDLEPGTYTMFCIVESEDGETHYENGMRGILTVG
jgi:plastocyanin